MNAQFNPHFCVSIKQIVKKYKDFCHKMINFARLRKKSQKSLLKLKNTF